MYLMIYDKLVDINTDNSEALSTIEILSMIQDGNVSKFPMANMIQDPNLLRIILKISEFEIRKVHDFLVKFPITKHATTVRKKLE